MLEKAVRLSEALRGERSSAWIKQYCRLEQRLREMLNLLSPVYPLAALMHDTSMCKILKAQTWSDVIKILVVAGCPALGGVGHSVVRGTRTVRVGMLDR